MGVPPGAVSSVSPETLHPGEEEAVWCSGCCRGGLEPDHLGGLWSPSKTPPGTAPCRVRELEKARLGKKNQTGTLPEQITFNEARRGSSQISELLH